MTLLRKFLRTLLLFTWNQALCCVFAVVIFASMAITKVVTIPFIPRYDLILIICIITQILMVRYKLETVDELKVITLFHIIGLGLEVFKVNMGSWAYLEPAWTKFWGAPLYSGFMYASIASYICQAWRRFHLQFHGWPGAAITVTLAVLIYANFFTHHYIYDFRYVIMAALAVVFIRTSVTFKVGTVQLKQPILISFLLIAFFIWVAENILTLFGAWTYPDQEGAWRLVHWGKVTSWFMLVIISIMIVVQLKHVKYKLQQHEYDSKEGVRQL
ncbi:DUF817 domain-containing protein [Paenibacillus sp. sptzw28]|uniref:DUF817 domain-containing protein n=1 Tax=Paenibacillus sp. sptzw28 TaxID=715179 RepID=UPI001C6E0EB0|nr:DUF817 domain-containing protein [Paenibacillus sp. sptzw28]QYR23503.1 DUF817 domain-containing protein [Paenibacillus sp. sptzw28]